MTLIAKVPHLLLLLLTCQVSQAAQLVLIIDDVGNNRELGERTVNLPGRVNLAFLPETPWASRLANRAAHNGHLVMLHVPMANAENRPLGPDGLTPDMDQQTLQQTLRHAIDSIPHVSGINNHMGSLLTEQTDAMRWVMEVLAEQNLFFVDSRTSAASVAYREAKAAGIPALTRDVFLDNVRTEAALQAQFDQALRIAEKRGRAVLIGHPYPETLDFLYRQLPLMADSNVRLAAVTDVLPAGMAVAARRQVTPETAITATHVIHTGTPELDSLVPEPDQQPDYESGFAAPRPDVPSPVQVADYRWIPVRIKSSARSPEICLPDMPFSPSPLPATATGVAIH